MQAKVLLIDDDEDDCLILKDSMKRVDLDCQVLCVCSGTEAFEYLSTNSNAATIIVLDMNMPKMNGLEVLYKLRGSSTIPVILYSTTCSDSTKERAKALGALDCIQKGHSDKENLHFAKYVAAAIDKVQRP